LRFMRFGAFVADLQWAAYGGRGLNDRAPRCGIEDMQFAGCISRLGAIRCNHEVA